MPQTLAECSTLIWSNGLKASRVKWGRQVIPNTPQPGINKNMWWKLEVTQNLWRGKEDRE